MNINNILYNRSDESIYCCCTCSFEFEQFCIQFVSAVHFASAVSEVSAYGEKAILDLGYPVMRLKIKMHFKTTTQRAQTLPSHPPYRASYLTRFCGFALSVQYLWKYLLCPKDDDWISAID